MTLVKSKLANKIYDSITVDLTSPQVVRFTSKVFNDLIKCLVHTPLPVLHNTCAKKNVISPVMKIKYYSTFEMEFEFRTANVSLYEIDIIKRITVARAQVFSIIYHCNGGYMALYHWL